MLPSRLAGRARRSRESYLEQQVALACCLVIKLGDPVPGLSYLHSLSRGNRCFGRWLDWLVLRLPCSALG